MSRTRPLLLTLATLIVLVGATPATAADESSDLTWVDAPAVVFDIMLLRPLSGVAAIVGLPFFVASVPFVAYEGEILTSWDIFVLAPYDYAVNRPLGDF